MLALAYDDITYDDDRTQVEMRPNCQPPAAPQDARYSCFTLGALGVLPGHRLRCERTDTLLRSGQPFVYPLELTSNARASLTANPELAPGIPRGVLAQARARRAVILVWIGHEQTPLECDPAGKIWILDSVQALVRDHDLPPEQVWFVTGNLNGHTSFVQWLRLRRLYEPEAFRFRALAFSPGSVQARYRTNERGHDLEIREQDGSWTFTVARCSASEFAKRYVQPTEIADELRSGRLRAKRFLCMNHTPRFHRQLIASYLAGRDALDDSLVSFPKVPVELNNRCDFPVGTAVLRDGWSRLHPKLPLIIDADRIGTDGHVVQGDGMLKLRPDIPLAIHPVRDSRDNHAVPDGAPYRQAYVNIVTETEVGYLCTPFSTEKVMKPILNHQPFIMVSTANTLRYLHGIGFVGYPELLDQSYDREDDPIARMARIFEQIDRVLALSPAELRDRYIACLPAVAHNRAHLIDGRHQLAELYDSLEAQLG